MARSVADAAAVLTVIAGSDPADPATARPTPTRSTISPRSTRTR